MIRRRINPPGLRGEELRAEAASRSRAGLRRRRESILVSARPIMHTAVAAALAWVVATELLGHDRPFFAPVAAVVTLGLSLGQRLRRAAETAAPARALVRTPTAMPELPEVERARLLARSIYSW